MMTKKEYMGKKIKEYYVNKKKVEIRNNYYNTKQTLMNKIMCSLRSRAYYILKQNNIKLNMTYAKLLGCKEEEYKLYLQSLFKENMTFENYGDWEIDHIRPISSFKLEDENELKLCFNYKNTQPLWKTENRKKYNKYEITN